MQKEENVPFDSYDDDKKVIESYSFPKGSLGAVLVDQFRSEASSLLKAQSEENFKWLKSIARNTGTIVRLLLEMFPETMKSGWKFPEELIHYIHSRIDTMSILEERRSQKEKEAKGDEIQHLATFIMSRYISERV